MARNSSWNYLSGVVFIQIFSICSGCTDSDKNQDSSVCWYTQWYIWFVLGLFIVVFFILIILYIKHRKKEQSRVRRLHRRNGRVTPIGVVPLQPPPYSEPSHKPPSYEEALSHSVYPSFIPGYMEPQIHQTNRKYASCIYNPCAEPRSTTYRCRSSIVQIHYRGWWLHPFRAIYKYNHN